jgi:hypothetical protein
MVTFVPIGPEVGVIVITGAVIVKLVVPTVPPDVVTSTGFAPQQTAVSGTLMLIDHRPEPSTVIAMVFQGSPSNVMPPTGIVSSGTKLEPVRVARVYGGPLLGDIDSVGATKVKVAEAIVPASALTIT